MASSLKNLSDYDPDKMPDSSSIKAGIVVAEWNEQITAALTEGAVETLKKNGVKTENISVKTVPGTVELTYGAKVMAKSDELDAVICIGCVIRGETPHFDYVCQSVTYGVTQLNIELDLPVVFGVLTVNSLQQAMDRCGGKYGNKGDEAAITAIKMASFNPECN